MRRFANVAGGVAWRTIHHFTTNPAMLVPSLVFPLFFLTAFAGGLSNVANVPGFDFAAGYTAFQFCFVLLQASAFGGVFTGFSIAADFESGFTRRIFLAAPDRRAIIVGYALAALTRALLVWILLFSVALLAGMQVEGGPVDLGGLIVLAFGVNVTAVLFAAGVATRLRTMQAGPLMQVPMFMVLFMAPVYVPLDLLEGWIHAAATVNPLTPMLELARDLIAGTDADPLAYLVIGGLLAAMLGWALTGMRRAERSGA